MLAICAIAVLLIVVVPRFPSEPTATTGEPHSGSEATTASSATLVSVPVNIEPKAMAPTPAPNALPNPEARGEEVQSAGVPEEAFHHDLPDTPTLHVPCGGGHGPADTHDAQCVARWAVFHLVTDQLSEASEWVDPAILSQQRASVTRELDPAEVLVLDAQDDVDQIGPTRAQIQVVVERTWPTGQTEHLYFTTVLAFDGAGGHWRLISLERH